MGVVWSIRQAFTRLPTYPFTSYLRYPGYLGYLGQLSRPIKHIRLLSRSGRKNEPGCSITPCYVAQSCVRETLQRHRRTPVSRDDASVCRSFYLPVLDLKSVRRRSNYCPTIETELALESYVAFQNRPAEMSVNATARLQIEAC